MISASNGSISGNVSNGSLHTSYIPVLFTNVTIDDAFWTPRLKINREQTIPILYQNLKETGRLDSLKHNWKPGMQPVPHIFWDSDVAKWLEAASYSYATNPDPALDERMDEAIALLANAQQPDGYLNTYYTVVEPGKRWTNLRDNHELYCAGHLIEAAVAHFQATGKRSLIDIMSRYADYIDTVFGRNPGQKRGYCGHQEIELALVKLYRVTGNKRYLNLSHYFVEERGQQPHYFDIEARERGEDPADFWAKTYEYNQSHVPVRELTRITGHAVRNMYYFAAIADLASETGDPSLYQVDERLWNDLTSKRMYITAGIGPSRSNEGFTRPYDLPNETAYAETCASVGMVLWNHRMLQVNCDRRYADIMERALYNGVLSGVELDGRTFFYENPLASTGNHHRQTWFEVSCCPPNLARLLASLGEYIYAQSEIDAIVHLYIQSTGKLTVAGQPVTLRQETNYPWGGQVAIEVGLDAPLDFGLRLRIPGWCREAHVSINGESISIEDKMVDGYVCLKRLWQPGDKVTLDLDMPVERVYAHPDVIEDIGRVALQRGPVVYCLEEVDHQLPLQRIALPTDSELSSHFEPKMLGGVTVITGNALVADAGDDTALYRHEKTQYRPCQITAVPYSVWDNREPGQMLVWMQEKDS